MRRMAKRETVGWVVKSDDEYHASPHRPRHWTTRKADALVFARRAQALATARFIHWYKARLVRLVRRA